MLDASLSDKLLQESQNAHQMADRLTKQQRSQVMSRIRGKDTTIELILRSALHRAGLRFRKNVKGIPGTPDIVFHRARLLVFVDGDFWHGYRFPQWGMSLSEFWQQKLRRNRARDRRCHARLRRAGWRVVRIWEHEIHRDIDAAVVRIANLLEQAPTRPN
jgi:DNA mismatch endonuclease (patch repair protein)